MSPEELRALVEEAKPPDDLRDQEAWREHDRIQANLHDLAPALALLCAEMGEVLARINAVSLDDETGFIRALRDVDTVLASLAALEKPQ